MVGVVHRLDASAVEDLGEHSLELLELRGKFAKDDFVMLSQSGATGARWHRGVDLP